MTQFLSPQTAVLDAGSARHRQSALQTAERFAWAMTWWARILLFVVVWLLLVGVMPYSDGTSSLDALLRQGSYLGMTVLALPLLVFRWRIALALMARSWAMLIVFAAMFSTVLWSQYPAVTIKRASIYVLLYLTAIGLASVLNKPRLYLPPLAASLALILFGNFFVTGALPHLAWSDIGLAGLHPSKNLAGMVGMVMAVVFAAMLVAVRQPLLFWLFVLFLLLSFVFLGLTLSKTSLGVTFVCVFGVLPALVLVRHSPGFGGLALMAALCAFGLAMAATGAFTLSTADWAEITTGDPTLTQRDDLWHAAQINIANAPWFGHGYGAVWSMLPQSHPLERISGFWSGSRATLQILNQSHNGYLDLFLHGGVYLFSIAMLFVAKTFADILIVAFRPGGDRWDAAGQAMFGAYFFGMLVNNILESTLFYPDGLLGVLLVFLVIAASAWRYSESGRLRARRIPATIWINPRL